MKKNLFIDTNIYLTFYHFSHDDLEELRKLSVAVENKRIKLYVTEQVINEFKRNREAKIADALKKFTSQKLPGEFPQICKTYEEYNQLRELLKQFEKVRQQLMDKLRAHIEDKKLGADEIIEILFDVGEPLEVDSDVIEKARTRIAVGNPPGESNSYGDAVNWETLLARVPDGQDLYLISDDHHYFSKIEKEKLAEYLHWEWKEKKGSDIYYYRRLSDFLRSEFPDIKLASELEKELAIKDFISSSSFKETRAAIKRLLKFGGFSDSEIRELIEASITNNQIYWIKDDLPVKRFLSDLVKARESVLDPAVLEEFKNTYDLEPEETAELSAGDITF